MKINKKEYLTTDNEFYSIFHKEYNFLDIKPEVGILERHVGLLNDMREDMFAIASLTIIGNRYGNFVASNCYSKFTDIHVHTSSSTEFYPSKFIYMHDNIKNIDDYVLAQIKDNECIVLAPSSLTFFDYYENKYQLTRKTYETVDYTLYIPSYLNEEFLKYFHYYLNDKQEFDYNNLINLCIMVKNAGEVFEKVLTENLDIIDRWTILDTGSTDGTQDIIRKVLKNKKGKLYEEDFVNFRDSRNACLDFAGNSCKYNLMLDDTYVIRGELKHFLETVRGDQFADSYSLIIQSDDTEYYSNRVTKSANNLRYIYKIHEVIQKNDNVNVVIPNTKAWIFDYRNDYMENRTMDRKQYDLKLLFEDYEDDPEDPRALYYIAQTYNLLKEHEKAAEYFLKRAYHSNIEFKQEKVDSLFEAARIYNFKLNKPWEECEKMYLEAYDWEPTRPDSLYFIGIHYYMNNDMKKAYDYMKKAFIIGYPVHTQFSLKPTLSFYYLPKFLAQLCYIFQDYKTGLECCELFLKHNTNPSDIEYINITSWYSIYKHILSMPPLVEPRNSSKTICYIADGGYSKWSGKDILTNGVGGSETYIIEMSRYIAKNTDYDVIVFCNCEEIETFEGVKYIPLKYFYKYNSMYNFEHCIISRFTEYLPVAYLGHSKNIHLVLHDLGPIGNVIPRHEKLKNIFCLTEWHKNYFLQSFPMFQDITHSFHYGIDYTKFNIENRNDKVKNSFIYSSFPNRGLSVLLKMWPKIKQKIPNATLDIYCDVYGKWVNERYPEEMKEIQSFLWDENGIEKYYNLGIIYHGWVSKDKLAEGWKKADIWFYPCKFAETFCLTALEAATSKTLAITNNLAALQDTVGNRGVSIEGDVTEEEWQNKAIDEIVSVLNDDNKKMEYITQNYEWSKSHTWEKQAVKFSNTYLESNNNLIFLTVFYNSEFIQILNTFLKSLYLFGNVNNKTTDIMIYTTSIFKNTIESEVKYVKYFNVKYAINDSYNTLDKACASRLDLFKLPGVNNYKQILYMDVDILITSDINKILNIEWKDDNKTVYACKNFTLDYNEDKGHIYMWGRNLFTDEEYNNVKDKNGISSGVLLIKNCNKNIQVFEDIIKDMNVRINNFYDQPFFNYHLIKNDIVEKHVMSEYVYDTDDENIISDNRTIVHFCGWPVGNSKRKLYKMNTYLSKFIKYKLSNIISETKQYINNKLMNVVNSTGVKLEGSLFNIHFDNNISDYYKHKQYNLAELLFVNNFTNVLEIGFNAGFSTLLMLLTNKNVKITCVDIGYHPYTTPCYNIIKDHFKDRVNLILGDSKQILPELFKQGNCYDFIHIDGGHGNQEVISDIENSLKLSRKDTVILMDDYNFQNIKVLWDIYVKDYNLQKYQLFENCLDQDVRIV